MAMNLFERLKTGLAKTRTGLVRHLDEMLLGEKVLSPELLESLEELLITADLGPRFADDLITELKERATRQELLDTDAVKRILMERMKELLADSAAPLSIPADGPFTIMVVGVNGTGKTTTIGKLLSRFAGEGRSVMAVAADTFRAAAIEQLEVWADRAGVRIAKQDMGADPAAVVYDALQTAAAKNIDVVVIDTAGRLHTKTNLMEELKKIRKVAERQIPGAPDETLLVLDATTGQNALSQARLFRDEIGVTGIVLTKLDGTAKGGIVVRIADELKLPIRYIGIGEGIDDLRPFDRDQFVDALFS